MSEDKTVWIITTDSPIAAVPGSKGPNDTGPDYGADNEDLSVKRIPVKASQLKQEMGEFLDVIEDVFEQADKPISKIELDEVELSVEINGEGKVSLFGIGGKAGGRGAIKLKFKRKQL